MKYQLLIDNNSIISGFVAEIVVIFIVASLIIISIIVYIWKKLRENGRLKYEFITIVAHKFRTPLTYVKWVCDELTTGETDPFKKKNIENIRTSNQKIIDLTSTLIEIADADNPNNVAYTYEKLLLVEVVKNVIDKFRDKFHEKNLFYSFNVKNDKIKVKVDRSRFEFALSTVLENACIYTPPGKNVTISITNTFFKASVIVEDTGIGISKQDLPHIFSKFFRGKNARVNDTEGFGVGLYLALSIMKNLGGKIKVESPGIGLGSRFIIILPRFR